MEDKLRLSIDATPAEAGARRFSQAVLGIRTAVTTASRATTGAFSSMAQAVGSGASGFARFASNVNGLNFNSTHRSIVGLTTGMRGLENAFSASFQAASLFRVAIGSLTLGTLIKGVFQASVLMERFMTTMGAATNSLSAAGDALRFTQGLAMDLGQDLAVVQEEFAQFAVATSIAGMSMRTTESIFSAVSTAMTVMGRSSFDARLSFLALQQMVSKGTVQTEELRRQLGERMPGAVQMMAEAVGVTTAQLGEMMKKGQVLTKEVLPRFAQIVEQRFGPKLATAFERADVQMRRLGSAFTMVQQQIGSQGFMDVMSDALQEMVLLLQSPEFSDIADKIGLGLADATRMAADAVIYLTENLDTLLSIGKAIIGIGLLTYLGSALRGALAALGTAVLTAAAHVTTFRNAWVAHNIALTVGTLPALSAVGKTSVVAARGVGLLGAAAQLAMGPIGLLTLALGAAVWYFWPDQISEAEEELERTSRTLKKFSDEAYNASEQLARLSTDQLALKQEQAAFAVEKHTQRLQELQDEAANVESSMAGWGAWISELLAPSQRDIVDTIQELHRQFVAGEIVAEKFILELAKIDGASGFVQNLIDKMVETAKAVDEATKEVTELQSAANNLDFEGLARLDRMDPRLQALDRVRAKMISLGDASSEAGGMVAEMEAEIARTKLDGYALELAKVQDETEGVKKKLLDTINALGGEGRFMTAKDKENLAAARAEYEKILVLEKELAAANFADDQAKAAEKLAKALEKQRDAARDLLDELYPVVGASREYAEGIELLQFAVKDGIIQQDQYNEAVKKLGDTFKEILDPLGHYNDGLQESLQRAERAVKFQEQLPGLTREHALAISDAVPLTEQLSQAQLELYANTIKADEALRNPPDPTGIRAFVDETKKVSEALADIEENAIRGVSDALTEFVTTGKLEINDLVNSIIKDLAQVGINAALGGLFEQLAGLAGGGGAFGAQGGSFLSNGMGMVSSLFGGEGATGGGILSGLSGMFSGMFRQGGYSTEPTSRGFVSASAFVNAPRFRDGGLTTGAIPAILHPNEAVVPLPGGRKIPVDLKGAGGESATNVTVHMTVNTPDASSFHKSKDQLAQDLGRKIGQAQRRNG